MEKEKFNLSIRATREDFKKILELCKKLDVNYYIERDLELGSNYNQIKNFNFKEMCDLLIAVEKATEKGIYWHSVAGGMDFLEKPFNKKDSFWELYENLWKK